MAREHSSAGDPTSSLVLLWRTPGARASPSGLGPDRIVQGAIELADADGLSAVSMRRVADRLGAGTMSLYTHVPGKAELLDAMLDVVLAETARPRDVPGGWRGRLEVVARENLALLRRHPWILEVDIGREDTGMTSGQWWNRSAPVLHQFLPPGRFPLAVRVGVAVAEANDGAHDPDHAFSFGLQRLLDGIEAYLREGAG
jgi:AcrR family transcriptional regulator